MIARRVTIVSVIIPAHNEASVIQRCLSALADQAAAGELEIIVVCNGCADDTAQIARRFAPAVRVIETPVASKANALNLGDAAASGFPRIYLDADVMISIDSVRKLAKAIERGEALAAAPSPANVFPAGASWVVKAYYAFWMALPYMQEGMMAAGVYAVGERGRARFGLFPEVISDDGYFRLHFAAGERVQVEGAASTVTTPANLRDLIRIRTRNRVGALQLRSRFPELFHREAQTKRYGRAMLSMLGKPRQYPGALPYLWVHFLTRYRAAQQFEQLDHYVWERDDSSR